MTLSKRSKRKHITAAISKLPPPGAQPLDYAMGGGGPLPPRLLGWAVFAGAVGLSVVISLAVGSLVIVGALPMLAVYFAANQPRGVLLTDMGVALFRNGFFNGRPTHLLGLDSADALMRRSEHRAGYTKVHIANSNTWLKDSDVVRLAPASRAT